MVVNHANEKEGKMAEKYSIVTALGAHSGDRPSRFNGVMGIGLPVSLSSTLRMKRTKGNV